MDPGYLAWRERAADRLRSAASICEDYEPPPSRWETEKLIWEQIETGIYWGLFAVTAAAFLGITTALIGLVVVHS